MLLDWSAREVPDGEPICEAGCGVGHIAGYLSRRGARMVGFDLSPGMIAVARRTEPGLAFRQGDMLDAPFPDASFAALVAFYAIVHLGAAELATALGEMHRILRPQGLAVISFHVRTDQDELRVTDFLDHSGADATFRFFGTAEVRGLAEQAGFQTQDVLERHPYGGVEAPTRRAYLVLRR